MDPLPLGDLDAFEQVRQLAASHHLVRSLHVVAELGVADLVDAEGAPIDVVALGVGADRGSLHRMLRLLATKGIFELEGSTVRQTAAAELLRSGPPGARCGRSPA